MSARPTANAHIIVINDDTDFLTLMSELLSETEDYDVQICREGAGHTSS